MQNILYEKSNKIAEHKAGAESCKTKFAILVNNFQRSSKQIVQEWAFHMEALFELGASDIPVNMICSYINRTLVDMLGSSRWESAVFHALDDRYKQEAYQKAGLLSHDVFYQNKVDLAASLAQATIYETLRDESIVEEFKKLSPHQKRECIPKLAGIEKMLEKDVIDAGLRLIDDDSSKKHSDPISTKFPEPRITTFYEEIQRGHKVLDALAEKVKAFPPSDLDSEKFREALSVLWDLWSSGTDNKWRASTMRWFRIIKSRFEHGKHAAAVLNFTKTNICKDCGNEMDESEYEHSKCFSCGSENAVTRALTREQVGDRQEHIVELAFRTCKYIPWIAEIALWQLKWKDRRNAKRSTDLRPKLSELA